MNIKNSLKMKILNIIIFLLFIFNTQAKWCTKDTDCEDTRYYACKGNSCCKNRGLNCGAGFSWPCCNRCRIVGIDAWGSCT